MLTFLLIFIFKEGQCGAKSRSGWVIKLGHHRCPFNPILYLFPAPKGSFNGKHCCGSLIDFRCGGSGFVLFNVYFLNRTRKKVKRDRALNYSLFILDAGLEWHKHKGNIVHVYVYICYSITLKLQKQWLYWKEWIKINTYYDFSPRKTPGFPRNLGKPKFTREKPRA